MRTALSAVLLLSLAACRGRREAPPRPDPVPASARRAPAVTNGEHRIGAEDVEGGPSPEDALPPAVDGGPPQAPFLVVFFVIDTVRADHTSLCGYDRPTTPTLQEMVKRGATYTCRAYSPAPWTHPSHASFFTGRSVVEHGAIWVQDSSVAINPVTRVRPLAEEYVTVAERFRDAGYQTAAITANMIITPPSGLLQGFDHVVVAEESYGLRGPKFGPRFEQLLSSLDPEKPLFLFVNLYDAHDPYPAIPEKVSWLPKQGLEDLHPNQHDADHPYFRFVKGLTPPDEATRFLRRVRNGYDWGVHNADANLGGAMDWLIQQDWTSRGFRVVVTADHGELLGEHRLLRHGGFLYEPVVRVPLVVFDSTAETQPALPEPASGLWVHDLLLYGRPPEVRPPVHAISEPNDRDVLVGSLGAAIWDGTDKIVCNDGGRARYDLAADPEEMQRMGLQAHPLVPKLRDLCNRADEMYQRPPPKEVPDYIRNLQAAGYME